LLLTRTGSISQQKERQAITMTKRLRLTPNGRDLKVTYSITNESQSPLRLRFASEWAFNLLAGSAPDRYYESDGKKLDWPELNSVGSLRGRADIRLTDEYLKLAIELRAVDADEIVRFPIESISLSEGGFERIYQGSILMPMWKLELTPGETRKLELTVLFGLLP
ncbi:MAG TPA: alpha-amylase/4-alpha-glucanotransferase domain-containing protein, partial [Candidatus Kapabacteria bacterium]|nr:alpha-amylase/4-alpha-glucanotransferase domain-containing protein [Candidatus Kapabacteria bacterium]